MQLMGQKPDEIEGEIVQDSSKKIEKKSVLECLDLFQKSFDDFY
jgi:hypothetical protein